MAIQRKYSNRHFIKNLNTWLRLSCCESLETYRRCRPVNRAISGSSTPLIPSKPHGLLYSHPQRELLPYNLEGENERSEQMDRSELFEQWWSSGYGTCILDNLTILYATAECGPSIGTYMNWVTELRSNSPWYWTREVVSCRTPPPTLLQTPNCRSSCCWCCRGAARDPPTSVTIRTASFDSSSFGGWCPAPQLQQRPEKYYPIIADWMNELRWYSSN